MFRILVSRLGSLLSLWAPSFHYVAPEEREEVQIMVAAVVELAKGEVTGIDLLEVYLSR